MLRVKGIVLGIGLPDIVIEVVGVGNCDGATVLAGVMDRVMLTDMV
jgi:hypothetical protein